MKNKIQKIIIWLFEKYAFDYWVDIQNNEERENDKQRYHDEVMIDVINQKIRDAYEEGVYDGINNRL